MTCRDEPVLEYIQPSELHEKMQDPSFLEEAQLIDVREPDEVYVHKFPPSILILDIDYSKEKCG